MKNACLRGVSEPIYEYSKGKGWQVQRNRERVWWTALKTGDTVFAYSCDNLQWVEEWSLGVKLTQEDIDNGSCRRNVVGQLSNYFWEIERE